MIKRIGIQNFRVFKEFTEFELRPLTILTGTNNSGKSSFTKLLLLLKNGVNDLDFKKGLHNLESFKKVLSWELDDNKLKISFPNSLQFLDDSYFITNYYIADNEDNGKLFQIEVSNEKESLLVFNYNGTDSSLQLDVEHLMSLVYEHKLLDYELGEAPDGDPIGAWTKKYIHEMDHNPSEDIVTLENFEGIFRKNPNKYSDSDQTSLKSPSIGNIAFKNTIRNLEHDYLLYNMSINGEDATIYHKDELLTIQKTEFKNIFFDGLRDLSGIPKGFNNALAYCLKRANSIVKEKIRFHFSSINPNDKVEIKETNLAKLLFTIRLFDSSSEAPFLETDYQKTFFDRFSGYGSQLNNELYKIEYISANRASQKRVLANSSEYDIDKIVVDFFNKSKKNIDFLKTICEILEIPGDLSVERFENMISIVYLKVNDRKIALSDVGFGFSQIIPIILKIVTITESKKRSTAKVNISEHSNDFFEISFSKSTPEKTIIIEEPEANLHPNLQSKLADVFVEIINQYPELNFIIETHSEYMIRKLQYLTAKNKIDPSKSIIYYFNADKYVSAKEPKVKAIEITSNGNLTDTFGPGFYDETTRLQFELMKLNQEQSN
jgi:predicted ATPase